MGFYRKYDSIKDISYLLNFFLVKSGDKYGVYDKTGKEILPVRYQQILTPTLLSKRFPVQSDNKWGLLNENGREIIAIKYEAIGEEHEKLLSEQLNGKWGFFDTEGKEVIPHKFDKNGTYQQAYFGNIQGFYDSLAMVMLGGKWGLIDRTGKLVAPAIYEEIRNIYDDEVSNAYIGKLPDEWHYMDRKGQLQKTKKFQLSLLRKVFSGLMASIRNCSTKVKRRHLV